MKHLTQETIELVKMLDTLKKVDFRVDKDYYLQGRSIVRGISYPFLTNFCDTAKEKHLNLNLNMIACEMCEEICEVSKEVQKKYEEKLSSMIFDELDKQYNRQEEEECL